ncbi:MAG: aggregation factor core [Pseudomonadota bacterium]
MSLKLAALLITASATAAHADLRVNFYEGAPKDRFRIENASHCTLAAASITLDLSTSPAGLIFDVTGAGAGVEVFQPFEIVEGAELLATTPSVLDGQSQIQLDVASLAPGQAIAFTIDVDDTLGQRAITVSGSEIEGATVAYDQAGTAVTGTFSSSAEAGIAVAGC